MWNQTTKLELARQPTGLSFQSWHLASGQGGGAGAPVADAGFIADDSHAAQGSWLKG